MIRIRLCATSIVVCVLFIAGLTSRLAAQGHPDFKAGIQPEIVAISQGGVSSFTLDIDTPFPSKQLDLVFVGAPAGVTFGPIGAPPPLKAGLGQNLIEIHAAPNVSAGSFPIYLTVYDHTTGSNDLYRALNFVLRIQPVSRSAQAGPAAGPWEYTVATATSPQEMVNKANQLGSERWELINTSHILTDNRYQWVAFFKRLKQ